MQSYKVQFNEQIRRFSLPNDSTYPQLRKKLEELFSDAPKGFQMYYLDEEQDKICINSQFEYDEAKRLNKQMIRIIIEIREPKKSKNRAMSSNENLTETSPAPPTTNTPQTSGLGLAQNPLVQTLLFIQPFITNPQLLKTILPIFLTEVNKNNIVSKEDIGKICLHANQILDYPFVQEFLTNKLPKILHTIVGSQHIPTVLPAVTTPVPIPVQETEPPKNERQPTEQIVDLFNNFMSFAQNVASNVTLPTIPVPVKKECPAPVKEESNVPKQINNNNNNNNNNKQNLNVNPSPAQVVKIPTPYTSELKQLKELGFPESNFLIELLNLSKGDINSVIDQMSD